jgi:hypothetical protein
LQTKFVVCYLRNRFLICDTRSIVLKPAKNKKPEWHSEAAL